LSWSQGIIVKADSLGSLEALLLMLRQNNIKVVKAGIGKINKIDAISAKANLEINELDAVILGFNVEIEEEMDYGQVKIFSDKVVYKLIENLSEWRKKRAAQIERERLMALATICKIEILPQYVFRNSNPAIFGVRVIGGKLRNGLPLIDEKGEEVAHVKGIQHEKASVQEAFEGQEVAMSLPGVNFERRLGEIKYLYSNLSLKQFKGFRDNKDLLSANELKILDEIFRIKGFG
jgi:translation initiation factor 5B